MDAHLLNNMATTKGIRRKFGWISNIRPQSLADFIIKMLPDARKRSIVRVGDLLLYIDPLSHIWTSITLEDGYEKSIVEIFQKELKYGDVYLDLGANEGFFSALAASLVGIDGAVIAIEPQSRLLDIIRINMALNDSAVGAKRRYILHRAIGPYPDKYVTISLTPLSNTGASSIVNTYKWSNNKECVKVITGEQIFDVTGVEHIDLVKIDIEGYEPEAIQALLPLMKSRRIRKILLDYHLHILRKRGLDPQDIHAAILDCGYKARIEVADFSGYCLYTL